MPTAEQPKESKTETMPKEASTRIQGDSKALNSPSEINKGELHRQKEREYFKKYYQKNKEKIKERVRKYQQDNKEKNREHRREYEMEYWRRRYHSDPEFREKRLEADRKLRSKLREEYKRFKIEYGGKCSVCGESDLDVLEPHHPNGRREKIGFINSKEFRDWLRFRTKPNVILLCSNHHQKLHIMEARGEEAGLPNR